MLRDTESDCLDQGNAASAPIDTRVSDLTINWNPSGYYEPGAIRQGVASVQAVLSAAFDALAKASDACAQAPGCSFPTWGDRYGALYQANNQAQDYLRAADQAESAASAAFKTPYVVAPGFKKWAISSLQAASDAITDSTFITCLMPWWADIVVVVQNAVGSASDVLSNIAGVAAGVVNATYQSGKAVLTAAAEGFSLVGWLSQNAPFLVGGVVLFFAGRYAWRRWSTIKGFVQHRLSRGQGSP